MADELTPEQQAAEEEALAGFLPPITVDPGATNGGPFVFAIPVLKMGRARRWHRLFEETFAALAKADANVSGDATAAVREIDAMAEATADLVVAYDQRSILGGREWLDEHATEDEVDAIYQSMVANTFHFASSPTQLVLAIARQVVASERAKRMNGPSPTGTEPPTNSTISSPSPSETSSGSGDTSDSPESSESA